MSAADCNVKNISEVSIEALISSISLPPPESITKLKFQGEYHLCYTLEYAADALSDVLHSALTPCSRLHNPNRLLLRISGKHLPHRKTENESAILAYVARQAPEIPVPTIVRYDSTTDNVLGHEYQIMTVCPGVVVDDIFRTWDTTIKADFLDQIVHLLQTLHSMPVTHIGGFAFAPNGKDVISGPICEEFMLQVPAVEKDWNSHGLKQSPDTLNAQGPFQNWTELDIAWLAKYIHAINLHPLMHEFRDMIPRLDRLIAVLKDGGPPKWKLNDMRVVVAHRDLHFGNIMYNMETRKISGIIDWEFSGAAPFCRWDPPKAFLASQPYDDEGLERKRGWVKDFKNRCEETNVDWRTLLFDHETGWSTIEQRLVHEAVDYMRCIFEVAPTGQRLDTVRSWRDIVIQRLEELNIA